MARYTDKDTEERVVALWEEGCHILLRIARKVNVYPLTVRRILHRRGIEVNGRLQRSGKTDGSNRANYIPSPEAIRKKTLLIQADWSETLRQKRRVQKELPYTVPEVHGLKDDGTVNGIRKEDD